jgi:hypothetical protein
MQTAERDGSPTAEEDCMSQTPLKSLIAGLIDSTECSFARLGFGLPFNEVIGKPRDMLVADLPQRLAATQKGKRIAVKVR